MNYGDNLLTQLLMLRMRSFSYLTCPGSNPTGVCEKVANGLGFGDGFRRVRRFPHQLQLATHDLAAIWQKN